MHLIDEILKLIQRVQDLWNQFVRAVNAALSYVPAYLQWAVDRINELWDQVVQMWNDFWDEVEVFLSRFGDPDAVSEASASWISDVASPAGSMAPTVSAGQLAADDDNWVGDAANKYRTRAAEQEQTIVGLRDEIATKVVAALDGLKVAMFGLYGAIISAFAGLVGGIIGGLASTAAPIVGIPAGILIILAAGGGAIGVIAAAFTLYGGHVDQRANELRLAITAPRVSTWPDFVA